MPRLMRHVLNKGLRVEPAMTGVRQVYQQLTRTEPFAINDKF
jgi:hypothetical protein